ncbi:MAG: hypothetical protein JSV91_04685, partial [Phycisphaerales bacterium]
MAVMLAMSGLADPIAQWRDNPPPTEDPPAAAPEEEPAAPRRPVLDNAPRAEQQTLSSLLTAEAWPRRAIAAICLERYGCDRSGEILRTLMKDRDWQVRAFAVRSLAMRRISADEGWFADEHEPRVLRTALRCRYPVEAERLSRGARYLARSDNLEEKMLAVEIGAASGDEELIELAKETARKIILRMDRTEAGALSPRLAAITDTYDRRKRQSWQKWMRQQGSRFAVRPGYFVPEGDVPQPPSLFAALPSERFAALQDYINTLGDRDIDLAICLDCTASMSGELAAAQGGIDDMMLFVGDMVASLRVALVAYRDRGDDFETKAGDFTTNIAEARRRLWQLLADGGGDTPEAVYPALRLAYTQLTWMYDHDKVLVLVGDAPPHVGFGGKCIDLARRAQEDTE